MNEFIKILTGQPELGHYVIAHYTQITISEAKDGIVVNCGNRIIMNYDRENLKSLEALLFKLGEKKWWKFWS
jgi:hypothetical protein